MDGVAGPRVPRDAGLGLGGRYRWRDKRLQVGGGVSSRVIPGTPNKWNPLFGKRDPYHSHIFRDSNMGIVWEAYHKGVPLLGVPENPID